MFLAILDLYNCARYLGSIFKKKSLERIFFTMCYWKIYYLQEYLTNINNMYGAFISLAWLLNDQFCSLKAISLRELFRLNLEKNC